MEAPRQLSRSRRRTARHLARRLGLRAALTALLLAALPAAPAHAAGGSAVIAGPGGTSFAISEEALRAGTEGGTYMVRAHPGEAGEAFTRTGVSVRQLVVLAGADPEAIGYVVVPRPDGTSAYLPSADFAAAPPFEAGLPVLVSTDSGCIRFLRPLTADPSDVNGEDNIASCAAPLTIGVRDGKILSVRASASSIKSATGSAVHFSAVAEGAEAGEALTYKWSFGDGTSAVGADPSHTFTAAGSYRVTVVATGSDESGGEAAPLTIVVGKPAATGTGAGAKAAQKPKRGATLSEPKATGTSPNSATSEAGTATTEPAVPSVGEGESELSGAGGPVVGPLPSRTAGRFGQGSEERPHEAPQEPPKGPRVATTSQAESGTKAEGTEAAGAGRTVRGRLVADFLDAAAAEPASGSGGDRGSESLAAAPAGGSASVPLTAILAAALLAGGVAFEWRRQGRGRLR